MHSSWVAFDLAADPVAQARLLRRAHEVVLSGAGRPPVLREVVVRSWERCLAAGVEPGRPPSVTLDAEETSSRFAAHPLAAVTPLVRGLLGQISEEARHVVAIADADGMLLWHDGHPRMLDAARGLHFGPGTLCSEAAIGTNGAGTALAVGHPVQIFSAEHFSRLLHGWTCAAAPVRDPVSGAIVGVIHLSESFRNAHPHTLALVAALAQAAETDLARERLRYQSRLVARYLERLGAAGRRASALVDADGRVLASSPRGWPGGRIALAEGHGPATLADGTRVAVEPLAHGARILWAGRGRRRRPPQHLFAVRALGVESPSLRLADRPLPVTPRQAELLIVLAMHPAGMSAEALARSLYGPTAKAVSARAEIARCRRVVGELIAAQPYRLSAEVHADFLELERLLRDQRLPEALDRYPGPLLPRSRAPAIVERRDAIEAALGAARRRGDDASLRRRWERSWRSAGPRPGGAVCNPLQPRSDLQHSRSTLEC